jgi:ankyrin repeat protein
MRLTILMRWGLVLVVVAGGFFHQRTTAMTQHLDSVGSDAHHLPNGWTPIPGLAFPCWLALEDFRDPREAFIFVFLPPRFFNQENLQRIFGHLASRPGTPFRLDITVLTEQEAIVRELRLIARRRAIGIFDFRENAKGREGRRQFLGADAAEEQDCLRAFYQRSTDGNEWFRYTADPERRERYAWINLRGGSPTPDLHKELIHAVEQGDIEVIERLYPRVVGSRIESRARHTLLMLQPKRNQEATVDLLLRNGEEINARDAGGWTPLLHAANSGDADVVKVLVERGADVSVRDGAGTTALALVAKKEYPSAVAILARKGNVNTGDKYGTTPLMWAAKNGDLKSIKLLLENGANPNARDRQDWTALFYVGPEATVVINALLSAGAQIDARDNEGSTPLMQVALLGDFANLAFLIEKGANVHLRNREGESALDIVKSASGATSAAAKLLESATAPR